MCPGRLDLLRLPRDIRVLAIPHITPTRGDLPVGAKLDAVGRVHVDRLDLAAEVLLLGEAVHDEQGVTEDQAVRPVVLVGVEVDQLVELQPVEVVEEGELGLVGSPAGGLAEVLDQRSGVDLLLDVDGDGDDLEVLGQVLLVLALPHQLRVEARVAGIEH
jgi:hypothetical protein